MTRIIESNLSAKHRLRKIEQVEGGGARFTAVVSEVDYVNLNNREYPKALMAAALDELLEHSRELPGLIGHPDYWDDPTPLDAAIYWERFEFEGNLVLGTGVTVATQKGRDLAALMLEEKLLVGFSTRGYGYGDSITIDGETRTVMTSYTFLPDGSIDAVLTPSVPHARTHSVSKESKDTVKETQMSKEITDRLDTVSAEIKADRENVQALTTALDTSQQQVSTLLERLASLESRLASVDDAQRFTSQLEAAIKDHRFAATIRAKAQQMESAKGLTAENMEQVLPIIIELVESAATPAAPSEEGTIRGVTPNEELKPDEQSTEMDEERKQALKIGLLI